MCFGLRPPAGEHIVGPLGQASVVVLSAHDNKPFPCERGSRGPPAVIVCDSRDRWGTVRGWWGLPAEGIARGFARVGIRRRLRPGAISIIIEICHLGLSLWLARGRGWGVESTAAFLFRPDPPGWIGYPWVTSYLKILRTENLGALREIWLQYIRQPEQDDRVFSSRVIGKLTAGFEPTRRQVHTSPHWQAGTFGHPATPLRGQLALSYEGSPGVLGSKM